MLRNKLLRFFVFAFVLCNILNSTAFAAGKQIKHRRKLDPKREAIVITPVDSDTIINKEKTNKVRPTIALALGGGGIRGAAHIGVLRVLQKEGIPIDYIAGCSMGSIIGGLYSAGISPDEIEAVLKNKSLQKAYAPGILPLEVIGFPLKRLVCVLTFRDQPYAGLFSGKKFRSFISKRLPKDKQLIENTDPQFVAVATNLLDGKAYKLAKGDLADCILASSAMAPIVRPVEIRGNLYMDGAIRSNVPVVSAKQFGADIVIAVPVDEEVKDEAPEKFRSVKNLTIRIADIVLSVADERHLQKADIVIAPQICDVPIFSKKLKYIEPTIIEGEKATYAALPQIKEAIEKAKVKISQSNRSD